MAKKKRKQSNTEQRGAIVRALVDETGVSEARAIAIVKRYGKSRDRCFSAAATYKSIERLGVGEKS